MAAKVKKGLTVGLRVSKSFIDFLKPEGLQKFVLDILENTARHVAGMNEGEEPNSSVIGRHFMKSNKTQYNYPPLSPKYAAWKKKKYGNKPILVRTGQMKKMALICEVIRRGDAKVILRPIKPVDYAKYHEKGGKNLPARPVYTTNAGDRNEINEYVKNIVHDQAGKLANSWVTDLQEVK